MSCYELHIGKNKYKIYNDQNITGAVSSSDNDLINDFVLLNVLPEGYKLEINDQPVENIPEVLPVTVLTDAITELQNPETNNERINAALSNTDYDWLVNKQIGNKKLAEYNSESLFDQNVLYRENWPSSSSWFGFTKQRMFVMTGNPTMHNASWDFLINLYNALKHDDQSSIDFVNSLYEQLNPADKNSKLDIFKKLSFLANNFMYELKSRTYSPFSNSIHGDQLKELFTKRLQNKEAAEKLKGKFFKYGKHIFEIIGMGKGDMIEIKSVDAEAEAITRVSISTIKSIYAPLIVTLNNKTDYELVGDVWRTAKNHKIVQKQDILKKLNGSLYECTEDSKNVVTFKDTLSSIDTETKLQDDSLLLDNLEYGDKIYTPMGKLTKMGNKENTFYIDDYGNEISINSKLNIYKIETSNNDLTIKLAEFIDLNPQRIYLQDEIKTIVFNLVSEFIDDPDSFLETVAFTYGNDDKIVKVQDRKVPDTEIRRPTLVISGSFQDTYSNLNELYMGIKYWTEKYTQVDELDRKSCNNELDQLRNNLIYEKGKMKKEERQEARQKYLPDSNVNLREKFNDFVSTDSKDAVEYNADPLIQKALEMGILTMECRING